MTHGSYVVWFHHCPLWLCNLQSMYVWLKNQNFLVSWGHLCQKLRAYVLKNLISIGMELVCGILIFFFQWEQFITKWFKHALLENQVLCHYTIPFKSNFSGMWRMPFHHTLVVVKGNVTMPLSWLLKWNGIHAIPPCNGYSLREYDNAKFFYCRIVEWNSCHSTIHWHKWKEIVTMPPCWLLPRWNWTCTIPPYIDTSGRQLWQCHFLEYLSGRWMMCSPLNMQFFRGIVKD